MHVSLDEAMSLLNTWSTEGVSLQVHSSRSGLREDLRGAIRALRGTIVEIISDSKELQIDLQGADFNGDKSPPPGSQYAGYLVCEFRNGDRCSFYVLRAAKTS